MPFCRNCGTEVAENISFCPKCGTGVGGGDILRSVTSLPGKVKDNHDYILIISAWLILAILTISGFLSLGYLGGIGSSVGRYWSDIQRFVNSNIDVWGRGGRNLFPSFTLDLHWGYAFLGGFLGLVFGMFILAFTLGTSKMWKHIERIATKQ